MAKTLLSTAHSVDANKAKFASALIAIREKQYLRAVELLTEVINSSVPNGVAEFLMAHLCQNGRGTVKNVERAVELYVKAWGHGEKRAALPLAKIYESQKNLNLAKKYYENALQYLEKLPPSELNATRKKEKEDAFVGLKRVKTELLNAEVIEAHSKKIVTTNKQSGGDLFDNITPQTEQIEFEPLRYLGECYEFGGQSGYSRELSRAVLWYGKAVERDSPSAEKNLQRVLQKIGTEGLPKLPQPRQFLVGAEGPVYNIYEGIYNEFGLNGKVKDLQSAQSHYQWAATYKCPFSVDPLLKRLFAEIAVEAEEHLARVNSAIAKAEAIKAEVRRKQAEALEAEEREERRIVFLAKLGLVNVLKKRADILAKEQHDSELKKLADELKALKQEQAEAAVAVEEAADASVAEAKPMSAKPVIEQPIEEPKVEMDDDIDFIF